MRTAMRVLIVGVASVIATACVPIGFKGTSLPYAGAAQPIVVAAR